MSVNKTESINILLILFSLGLSFIFPFELFLFSYAILGPLHYCTEISWLHDKNYFTIRKKSVLPLYFLALIFFLGVNLPFIHNQILTMIIVFSIAISFIFSFVLIYNFNSRYSFFYISIILGFSLFVYNVPFLEFIFYYFFGTLIHVYIFTGFFILQGNLKRHNLIGHIGFVLFLLAPFICLITPIQTQHTYDYFKNNYSLIMNSFITDNFNLLNISLSQESFFQNEWVIKVSRFISFAYTYHYLNWFSKTNIIGWYNISFDRKLWIFSIWIFSILFYFYNYMVGYQILLFLSMLHVFLEFPLNWISILGLLKIKTH